MTSLSSHSLTALLFYFLFPFLVSVHSKKVTPAIDANITNVVETSIIPGPSGKIIEIETFLPKIYSSFTNLSSTIHTATVITVHTGTSAAALTYSYDIGPGGVGWTIPSASNGAPVVAQPPFLPGDRFESGASDTLRFTDGVLSQSSTKPISSSKSIANSTSTIIGNPTGPLTRTSTGSPHPTRTTSSGRDSTVKSKSILSSSSSTSSSGTSITTFASISTEGTTAGVNPAVVGSSTISSRTNVITSTISSVPADFTGITLSGTTFTANDWIITTDSDHHTTLLPFILVGGGRGVVFRDLPLIPDVEFSLPGFPKFHLPCIKIFGIPVGDCTSPPSVDGPPPELSPSSAPTNTKESSTQPTSRLTTTASSSSSSRPTCTASNTASDCTVSCVSSVSSSSCASYTTTCTQTSTGCSVQGTTITVTPTGACLASPAASFVQATQTFCNGGCLHGKSPGTAVPSYSTSGPDPTPDDRKRAIAGRITVDPIKKRASSSAISTLGGCPLSTPTSLPLTLPGWPSVFTDMLQPERAGNLGPKYKVISRYDRATNHGCVFTTTRLDANNFLNAPNWQDYLGRNFNNNNNDGSLDHAYEKDWLKQFFGRIISSNNAPNALTCAQTNQYFFPTSSSCSYNIIQDVWDQLAGNDNLKFIAMSQYLNGNAKGMFFPAAGQSFQQSFVNDPDWLIPQNGAGWTWPTSGQTRTTYSAEDALYHMIGYFETVLYGVLEMKSDNLLDLIDRTNNGIYGELKSVDSLISSNPGNLFGNIAAYQAAFPQGLAGAYQDFITSTIEPQITAPPQYLTSLWTTRIGPAIMNSYYLPNVGADPNNPNQPGRYKADYNNIYNLLVAHNKQYYVNNAFTWEYTFSFSWDITRNKKRDINDLLKGQGSCHLRTNSNSAASSSSTSSDRIQSTGPSLTIPPTHASTPHASCSFVATVFPSSLQSIAGSGTRRYCQCGETVAGINMATSGTVTTTYCALGNPLPTGYSQIHVNNGVAVTSTPPPPAASLTTVPPPAASLTTAPPPSSVRACIGNQIAGSCTQASLKSSTPNSGPQTPVCWKVETNHYVRFNASKAAQAVARYCADLISSKTIINAQHTAPSVGKTVSGGAEKGGEITLNILFDVNSCDPGTSTADQKVDFAAMGQDTCYENLYTALAQICAQDSTWRDYDANYTLEGGAWARNCAIWSMSGLITSS